MTWRVAVGFALLLCVGGFGLAATFNNFAVVDAVNTKLPPDAQFNHFGWYLTKTMRLHREYRRLYPAGRLLRRQGVLAGLMFLCLLVAALFLGLGFIVILWPGSFLALMLWFTYFRKPPTNNDDAKQIVGREPR
jgi:4-hydroxybenzoate polyprenyltransferase